MNYLEKRAAIDLEVSYDLLSMIYLQNWCSGCKRSSAEKTPSRQLGNSDQSTTGSTQGFEAEAKPWSILRILQSRRQNDSA